MSADFDERLRAAQEQHASETDAAKSATDEERLATEHNSAQVSSALEHLKGLGAEPSEWNLLERYGLRQVHSALAANASFHRYGREVTATFTVEYSGHRYRLDFDVLPEPRLVTGRAALPADDRSETYSLADLLDTPKLYLWEWGWGSTLPIATSVVLDVVVEGLVSLLAANSPA